MRYLFTLFVFWIVSGSHYLTIASQHHLSVDTFVTWTELYCQNDSYRDPRFPSSILCISDNGDPYPTDEQATFAFNIPASQNHPHSRVITRVGFVGCSGVGCRVQRAIGKSPGTRTFRGASSAARGHHP